MTVKQLKATIDSTGEALLTLYNTRDEFLFVGNVEKMNVSKGRLHLRWIIPSNPHVSSFEHYIISQKHGKVLWTDEIKPIRLDTGKSTKFELKLDYI